MLSLPASEIRLAVPANPLAFTMHFYAAGGPTQHKFILLSKTNLSPAQETLKNAADTVDRMKETKTFKNPQPKTAPRYGPRALKPSGEFVFPAFFNVKNMTPLNLSAK
jgi:hypothetical protein